MHPDKRTLRSSPNRLEEPQAAPDSRKDPCFPMDFHTFMRLLNPVEDRRIEVQVRDILQTGIKIECDRYITPGATVLLRLEASHVLGNVRYCVASHSGFYCGI